MLVSIIIPVFNEEKTIYEILSKINKLKNIEKEIIVIDDGSTDNSKKIILEKCNDFISKKIFLDKNNGKGFACNSGIKIATGEIILIQDADLEYNPENYYDLLEPFKNNNIKAVYGSRILKGGKRIRPDEITFIISKLANYFLTFLSNLFNNQKLTDAHTCYKVVRKEVMNKISLKEKGFNFCPELTAKISKLGFKIHEVPIDYFGRNYKDGKKINFVDGLRAIYAIIRYNLF
tara:strand:+ start:712 stop:1410 length:699 start_codon:yes stop_codon:yes gene_type:complete